MLNMAQALVRGNSSMRDAEARLRRAARLPDPPAHQS
jgi:hypothetical protein